MSKRDHTDTLQGVLRGNGLNIPDSQIYAGPFHEEMAGDVITMIEGQGSSPEQQFNRSESVQHPRVQVRIRHDDKTQGKADADDVWRIVQDWDGGSNYSPPDPVGSGAAYTGTDDDGRHIWTANIDLFICE